MTNWIETKQQEPPKNEPFWAYLYQTGIRLMEFVPASQSASEEGGEPEDYLDAWCEVRDHSETWEPAYWLPKDALPEEPPLPK